MALGHRHPSLTAAAVVAPTVLVPFALAVPMLAARLLHWRSWQRRDGALLAGPSLYWALWAAGFFASLPPVFRASAWRGVPWQFLTVCVVIVTGAVLSLRQSVELRPTGITVRAAWRRRERAELAWEEVAEGRVWFGRDRIRLAADNPRLKTNLFGQMLDVDPRVIVATIARYVNEPAGVTVPARRGERDIAWSSVAAVTEYDDQVHLILGTGEWIAVHRGRVGAVAWCDGLDYWRRHPEHRDELTDGRADAWLRHGEFPKTDHLTGPGS